MPADIRESGDMELTGTSEAGVLTLTTIASGAEDGDMSAAFDVSRQKLRFSETEALRPMS